MLDKPDDILRGFFLVRKDNRNILFFIKNGKATEYELLSETPVETVEMMVDQIRQAVIVCDNNVRG